MKKFLAILILSLLALSLAANAVEVVGEMDEMEVQKWTDITCRFLEDQYACPVGQPAVGIAVLPRGEWGTYYGMNFLVINEKLRNPQWGTWGEAILMHEIAHWIVRHANPDISTCDSEAVAWRVYNAHVKAEGRDDLLRPDWVDNYPDCKE